MEGIAAARLRGVYKGRPASIDPGAVAALNAEGLGAFHFPARLQFQLKNVTGVTDSCAKARDGGG